MNGQSDKRVLERHPVDFMVVCLCRGQQQQGRALNLSSGGVLVTTPSLIPVGSLTEISLAVAGGELFQFKGIVRHNSQDLGMGIEFVEVLPQHQARLVAYLDVLGSAQGSAPAPD